MVQRAGQGRHRAEECPFRVVECVEPGCGAQVPATGPGLVQHREHECPPAQRRAELASRSKVGRERAAALAVAGAGAGGDAAQGHHA